MVASDRESCGRIASAVLDYVDIRIVIRLKMLVRSMDVDITAVSTFRNLLKQGLKTCPQVKAKDVSGLVNGSMFISLHSTAQRTMDSSMVVGDILRLVQSR